MSQGGGQSWFDWQSRTLFLLFTPDNTTNDEDAFRARCRERFGHYARVVAATIGLIALAFWPSDLITLRRLPALMSAFAEWRLSGVAAAAMFLLLSRIRLLSRHMLAGFTLFGVAAFFAAGHAFGLAGGPELPYIHFSYLLPFATIPLPLELGRRTLVTAALAGAILVGFFLPFPAHRASPYGAMLINHMLGVVTLSLIFGQLLLMLMRQNFYQAQELARRAAELAAHQGELEGHVAEKTRELRQLISHVEIAQEAERTRIARELHDALGQELLALRYALSYTISRFGEDPAAIRKNLDELESLLARTTKTAREIMAELRPQILDDLGLYAAAEWLVSRVGERCGIDCQLRVQGDGARLDASHSTAAFRILQEALSNVLRHAAAQHVEVLISVGDNALELSVSDDGIGMATAPREGMRGMGLLGMRERVGILGGKLEIRPRTAGGTEIHCRLPLPPTPGASPA